MQISPDFGKGPNLCKSEGSQGLMQAAKLSGNAPRQHLTLSDFLARLGYTWRASPINVVWPLEPSDLHKFGPFTKSWLILILKLCWGIFSYQGYKSTTQRNYLDSLGTYQIDCILCGMVRPWTPLRFRRRLHRYYSWRLCSLGCPSAVIDFPKCFR